MLAVILIFEPRYFQSALHVLIGPLNKRKRGQAMETLGAAAILLREWGLPPSTAHSEVSEDNREKALIGMLSPLFRSAGRIFPLSLARQLEICVRALKFAETIGTRSETHLPKYIVSAYVQAVAPRAHDRVVSVLIAECFSLPGYNASQHKMWRKRHFDRLERRFELKPLLEEIDLEVRSALGQVTVS